MRARQSLGMRPPLHWTTSAALAFIFPTASRMMVAGMLVAVLRKRLLYAVWLSLTGADWEAMRLLTSAQTK